MYRKRDDLKQLINSLSMSEKRHFSLFSKAFIGTDKAPLYLQLFAEFQNNKSESSDSNYKLSKQNQTHAARRLYQSILKSLLLFHEDSSVDITIQNLLNKIEILYHLALPEQCLVLLDKAYKLASRHEKFGLLLHILQWERKINIISKKPKRNVEVIVEEEQQILHKLIQITHLENLYSKTRDLKKKFGYVTMITKKGLSLQTIASDKMPPLDKCDSQIAKYYYYFIHALYSTIIYEHQKAYNYSKNLLSSSIQFILPNDYIDGMLAHVTSCICIGYFEEALKTVEASDTYTKELKLDQSESYKLLIFYYKISTQLIAYNYIGNKKQLQNSIVEAEKKLELYDNKLPLEMKQVILGNLRNAYVGIGDWDNVDLIMEKLFRKESKEVRKEIYDDLYLFRLFNLLQNKNYVLLTSMALSAHRYYKQQTDSNIHFSVELNISSLLLKEHNYENTLVTQEILQKINHFLSEHLVKLNVENDFQEYYSFYIIWVNSMLHSRPFHAEASVWFEQHNTL